jgi:hypothetical protein
MTMNEFVPLEEFSCEIIADAEKDNFMNIASHYRS